jgi:hypothetical protein
MGCLLRIWWGFFIILPFFLLFFPIDLLVLQFFLNSCYSECFFFFLIIWVYFMGLFWLCLNFFMFCFWQNHKNYQFFLMVYVLILGWTMNKIKRIDSFFESHLESQDQTHLLLKDSIVGRKLMMGNGVFFWLMEKKFKFSS